MTDNERIKLLLKAKPILFNTDMVMAILDGRKTVTRRVIKEIPETVHMFMGIDSETQKAEFLCGEVRNGCCFDFGFEVAMQYKVGDILYVRETYGISNMDYDDKTVGIVYKASENIKDNSYREIKFPNDKFEKLYNSMAETSPEWHPSIHMPREAARIFLRVTNVRVERLQDISDRDLIREGEIPIIHVDESLDREATRMSFLDTWNSTIKSKDLEKYGWNANPWVWVIEFERID